MKKAILIIVIAVLSSSFSYAQDFWQQTNGPTMGYIKSLAANGAGHIFAATGAGVFRTMDNGDSWASIHTGITRLEITCLAIDSKGHLFAGTDDGGVFTSTDNGDHWTSIGLKNIWVISLAINFLSCFHSDGRAMVSSERAETAIEPVFTLRTKGLRFKPFSISVGVPMKAGESVPTHRRQHHAKASRFRDNVCQGLSAVRCQSGT